MRTPRLLLIGLFLLDAGTLFAQSHDQAFNSDGLKTIHAAADQPNFTLALHPDAEIVKDHNVLWCNTMQLAWNEAIGLVGEKLHFINAPPEVAWLNQQDYTRADLDSSCYVALADFWRNHVDVEIRAALQEKFGGEASPKLIPQPPKAPSPDDFVAYAYLFKNLSFPAKFAKDTLAFAGTTQVKCFGFNDKEDATPERLQEVSLLSYKSDDDFVLQLKTKVEKDQLILAKVTPGASLASTIKAVLDRVNHPHPEALTDEDRLAVPLFNFDITSHFPQLEGLVLSPSPAAKVQKLVVSTAMQNIRFQLNEEGVKLKSEATIVMSEMAMPMRSEPHRLIFDQPFLILMKQENGKPYFAMWVGNSDFSIPAE